MIIRLIIALDIPELARLTGWGGGGGGGAIIFMWGQVQFKAILSEPLGGRM